MADDRIELNEQELDDIVGGSFNWYNERGTTLKRCRVTGVGTFYVTSTAKARYNVLMLEHKGEGWTEQDVANKLLAEGEFSTTPFD